VTLERPVSRQHCQCGASDLDDSHLYLMAKRDACWRRRRRPSVGGCGSCVTGARSASAPPAGWLAAPSKTPVRDTDVIKWRADVSCDGAGCACDGVTVHRSCTRTSLTRYRSSRTQIQRRNARTHTHTYVSPMR